MHRLQIERYDQRDRIGKERVHVYRAQIASGALTLTAMVISDAAIPEFERSDLRREQRTIPEEAMAEQDRWTSATGILVIELGTIDTEHGHDHPRSCVTGRTAPPGSACEPREWTGKSRPASRRSARARHPRQQAPGSA